MRRFQLFDEFAGPVTGEQVLKHGRHNQKDHAGKGRARSDDEIVGLAQQRAGVGKTLDKSVVGDDGFGYISSSTGERFALTEVNPTGAARIIAAQGWDAPAQSVDQETFDRLAQRDDLVTVYRGGPVGLEKGMIEGTPYIGDGKSGPGTYVTDNPDRAARFANKWVETGRDEAGFRTHDIYQGNVVPMLMPRSMFDNPGNGEVNRINIPLTNEGLRGVGAVTGFMGGDRVVWNTGAMIVGPAVPSEPGREGFAGRWTLDDVTKSLEEPPTEGEVAFYRIENGEATLLTDSSGSRPEVIKFAPGLVPVLKHGRHDQSTHGRRGGASRPPVDESPAEEDRRRQIENINYIMGRSPFPPGFSYEGLPPPTVTLRQLGREQVTKVRRRIKQWKQARERRYLENLSPEAEAKLIAANRARVDAKRAARGLPPVVYKAMDPVLPLLYDVFRDVVDDPFVWIALIQDERPLSEIDGDLGDILDDMLDAVAPAETVIKFAPGLRPTLKHLSGKHDQKTHGRGGQQTLPGTDTARSGADGPYAEWGDRAKEIRFMESAGMSKAELDAYLDPDTSYIEADRIRQAVDDDYSYAIDNRAKELMNDSDSTDKTLEDFREEALDEYVAVHGETTARLLAYGDNEEFFDADVARGQFSEVYDTYHEGINRDGEERTIEARIESVVAPSASDPRMVVSGTLYGDDGYPIGEIERSFAIGPTGRVEATHELLRIHEDDYQGTGFSKVINRQAENYYISHDIDTVRVHAALEGGGYAWASQGFDWDYNNHNKSLSNMNDRYDAYMKIADLTPEVRSDFGNVFSRLNTLPVTSDDYPTPSEIANLGRVDGVSTWPGKTFMRGSNYYGTKTLVPEGSRESRTTIESRARAAEQRAFVEARTPGRGQMTMDSDFLEGALANSPVQTTPLFAPIPGVVE